MRPGQYLRLLRRRWWALPLVAVLGMGASFATRPVPMLLLPFVPASTYQAKHVMVSQPIASSHNPNVDYDRLAFLATTGDGPLNVANTLGLGAPATAVAQDPPLPKGAPEEKGRPRGTQLPGVSVIAVPSSITGSLTITAAASNKRLAIAAANAIAYELTILLNQPSAQVAAPASPFDVPGRIGVLQRQRSDALHQVNQLGKSLAAARARQLADSATKFRRLNVPVEFAQYFDSSPEVKDLQSRREQLSGQIAGLDKQVLELISTSSSAAPIVTLTPASDETTIGAFPIAPAAPTFQSGWPRTALGGGIGILVGVVLLLLLEIVRPRIRDVRSAEVAAHMPLVAEIPRVKLSSDEERFRVAAAEEPSARLAEAYRDVRTSLLAMWPRHPANANGSGKYNGSGPPLRTLLVSSAGPNEGKSTSVVNLAAAFAETGRAVIVLDADFLRPTLHRYFHRAAVPNLGSLDPNLGAADLGLVLQETAVPGVRFAAAPPLGPPAGVLAIARAAVARASELADIVILDSPPLLAASTASDLATVVDATLLVIRSDWTRRRSAIAAAEHLRRIEAKVIGVILVDAQDSARSEFAGYYSRRAKRADTKGSLLPSPRRRRARRRAAAARVVAESTAWPASASVVDLNDAEFTSVPPPRRPAPTRWARNAPDAPDDNRPQS